MAVSSRTTRVEECQLKFEQYATTSVFLSGRRSGIESISWSRRAPRAGRTRRRGRSSPSGLRDLLSSRCSSPFHRTQYEEWDLPLRLCLEVVVGRIHLDHLLPEADFLF